jgi:hypothetical protein
MSRRHQNSSSSQLRNALIALAVVVSAALGVLAFGAYPIATVNGEVIWTSSFRSYLSSAVSYQQASRDTYGATSTSTPLLAALEQGETSLGAAALDDLVEQKLVEQGLENLVGDNTPRLVSDKLSSYRDRPELAGASRALFQLDPEAFTGAILAPQAEREVLNGRLYIDSDNVDEWLTHRRREAKVRIWFSPYTWSGEAVQPN